jgi:gas vesicle protein
MDKQGNGTFNTSDIILSFLFGGLIGAGVALLTAPKTGEETRKMIKDLTEDAKQKLEDYAHVAQEKATTYVEKGKELIEKEKDVIAKAVEAGKEVYKKAAHS